jgi:hypothetical protein
MKLSWKGELLLLPEFDVFGFGIQKVDRSISADHDYETSPLLSLHYVAPANNCYQTMTTKDGAQRITSSIVGTLVCICDSANWSLRSSY